LGKRISDPDGIEGAAGDVQGLGLLDVETVLCDDKALETVSGTDIGSGEKIHGYEMHLGLSEGPDRSNPWVKLDDGRTEGALSAGGRVMGSYLHGIFAADGFRRTFLSSLRSGRAHATAYDLRIEEILDALASHLEKHMDLNRLYDAARKID